MIHRNARDTYAPNVRELQRRKVVVRKKWNPMRLFRGPFKYIKL